MRYILLAAAALLMQPTAQAAQPPAAPVDADRLAAAMVTVDYIWPAGTYARMMDGTMNKMMDAMVASMFDMKMGELAKAPPADQQNLSLREAMLKLDPHFEERMRIMNRVMMDEMVPIATAIEPEVRQGLARAYARKFSVQQLTDLNRFFSTPNGKAYAADSMMMWVDPEVVTAFSSAMPEMMKAMPAIMKKVEAATAHLPPPPKPEGEQTEQKEESVS